MNIYCILFVTKHQAILLEILELLQKVTEILIKGLRLVFPGV